MFESGIEAFLLRCVPDLEKRWVGASPEEIAQIEKLAGLPLPSFYIWFLSKMGKETATLLSKSRDMTAQTILSAYADGRATPESGMLLIGYQSDPIMPSYIFYDLARSQRDDALVVSRPVDDSVYSADFETLREMLAWGVMLNYGFYAMPHRCKGSFMIESGEVLPELGRVLKALGFVEPIPTGSFCGLFERSDACVACYAPPRDRPEKFIFFHVSAASNILLRQILGAITTESSVTVKVKKWDPPIGT